MPSLQPVAHAAALSSVAKIRSEVFQTVYNPHGLRTGDKYLRKRLRGPSILNYYAPKLSYRALNAETPYNAYANWQGQNELQFRSRAINAIKSNTQREKWGQSSVAARLAAAEQTAAPTSTESGASEGVAPNGETVQASVPEPAPAEEEQGSTLRWRSTGQALLKRDEILSAGFTEVERIPGAGWIDDGAERLRKQEVEIRRLMGKGPPKKGSGKRSQMKKKK